jgi:hypothetical protein
MLPGSGPSMNQYLVGRKHLPGGWLRHHKRNFLKARPSAFCRVAPTRLISQILQLQPARTSSRALTMPA